MRPARKLPISAAITLMLMAGALCLGRAASRDTCAVTLSLLDASTGKPIAGLVRITDADGRRVRPVELASRGIGLESGPTESSPIHDWLILSGKATIPLSRGRYILEAISGIETELARQSIDLTNRTQAAFDIPLVRFSTLRSRGWRSGNTHLHLKGLTRPQADRYLTVVPRSDDLDLVFVSYLERAGASHTYVSNTYRLRDLERFGRLSGVRFGNGEEHRHNFAGDEGYGHVMLLNLKELVQPVSLGPDIARQATDGIPLRRGIDAARRQPAYVIWCHNDWGRERIPSLVSGRLDALNLFDGSIRNTYRNSYYRDLNAGFRLPLSTGTDWFIYDFSRVYVLVSGEATVDNWLKSLAAGRTFITNGPLLELSAGGKNIGDVVAMAQGGRLRIEARGAGRVDFNRIELVRNGTVIDSVRCRQVGGHYEAMLTRDLRVDSPCWLALRTPPPPIDGHSISRQTSAKNEFGKDLFAHTSAVHVEIAGRRHFDRKAADAMLADMQASRELIVRRGLFADDQERARVLDVYADAVAALNKHIAQSER